MSVRIRLKRMGTNKKPFYRIVVADQRFARGGRFIEALGTYDTRENPPAIKLDTEKTQKWLGNGAQPSDTVRAILVNQGLLERLQARPVPAAKAAKAEAAAEAAPKEAPKEAPKAEPEAAPEAAAKAAKAKKESAPAEEAAPPAEEAAPPVEEPDAAAEEAAEPAAE